MPTLLKVSAIALFHFTKILLQSNQSLYYPITMSTSIENTQTTKIEITLTEEQREILQKAAFVRCLTLSEYLLEAALNLAEEPLEPESIVLSERDWEIVTAALENPPEPNEALKAAIKEYQEKYGKW